MISVCLWRFSSPRLKRIAIPRGSALPSVSGIWGIPVELEKRTQIEVLGAANWGAMESLAASGVGVNVPVKRMPLAWAGRVLERVRCWKEELTWSKSRRGSKYAL